MIILVQYFYVYIYIPILSRESRVWLLAHHVCAYPVVSVVISICAIEIDVGFMVPITLVVLQQYNIYIKIMSISVDCTFSMCSIKFV
jgi:hypothetical protein